MIAVCITLVLLLSVLSCSTYNVKDSEKIAKVDKKILSEFYENISEGEFFGACRSYIEFLNCCNDSRVEEITDELESLYLSKIEELTTGGDTFETIQYTYSFVNVTRDNLTGERWDEYNVTLTDYMWQYATVELSSKGDLEKASLLFYLTNFSPEAPFLYRELAVLFLERKNPLLARKYFDIYRELEKPGEERY